MRIFSFCLKTKNTWCRAKTKKYVTKIKNVWCRAELNFGFAKKLKINFTKADWIRHKLKIDFTRANWIDDELTGEGKGANSTRIKRIRKNKLCLLCYHETSFRIHCNRSYFLSYVVDKNNISFACKSIQIIRQIVPTKLCLQFMCVTVWTRVS